MPSLAHGDSSDSQFFFRRIHLHQRSANRIHCALTFAGRYHRLGLIEPVGVANLVGLVEVREFVQDQGAHRFKEGFLHRFATGELGEALQIPLYAGPRLFIGIQVAQQASDDIAALPPPFAPRRVLLGYV